MPGEGGGAFAAEDRPDLQEEPGETPGSKPQISREDSPKIHSSDEAARIYFGFVEYLEVLHHWERGSGCPLMPVGSARTESCPGGQRKVKD